MNPQDWEMVSTGFFLVQGSIHFAIDILQVVQSRAVDDGRQRDRPCPGSVAQDPERYNSHVR